MPYYPAPPFAAPWPLQGPRTMYLSVAQVTRLTPTLTESGDMALAWNPISDIVDVWLGTPGMLTCRLDIGFIRRGIDAPRAFVAGRAPDRVGVAFFDPIPATNGSLLIRAGDRLVMTDGPVYGTWEMRAIPDPAQGLVGVHHMEVQVVEVAQQLGQNQITPFPGGAP